MIDTFPGCLKDHGGIRKSLITIGKMIAAICEEKKGRVHVNKFSELTSNIIGIGYILHPMFLVYSILILN